jgi:cytochrome c-type biogenesis protein CcmH/NrfG
VIAFDANDLPAARDFFYRALAVDPRDAKSHYLLARTAACADDLATTKAEIAKAIALDHHQPEFRSFERELTAKQPPE